MATANIGFEETLWKAADKLRGSMDSGEYKYVVLGLIFVKYISEKFSEKLKKSLNKYRNQAITNAEVINELVNLARELKTMKSREGELGLSKDEIAFYDALTADDVVTEFMGSKVLKQIAQELTDAIRTNVTIDWSFRKSAQAGMRKIIKRLLKKYKYPPEQSKKALETVMRQAELMCGNVSM